MRNILLVDGYNIICAWPELIALKDKNLQESRDQLISIMADYQGYTGFEVIVVFDAYAVKGIEKKLKNHKIEVIFTKAEETADQRIEKLAIQLNKINTQVHVATSDFTEQWAVFGQGALRISANELRTEIHSINKQIDQHIEAIKVDSPITRIDFDPSTKNVLEKWRRGEI